MYIPEFLVGVITTVLFEITAIVAVVVISNIKETQKNKKKERKCCNDKCNCNHDKSK